jgi:hypothetical protein
VVIGKRLKVDGLYVVSVEVFGGGKRHNIFLVNLMSAMGIYIHQRDAPAIRRRPGRDRDRHSSEI